MVLPPREISLIFGEPYIEFMILLKKYFSALILALFLLGCQGSSQPSKEQLISDLKSVYELLSKGDNLAAVDYFKGPDGIPKEDLAKDLGGILEKRELSLSGIEVLEKNGKFGKLSEIFPERGERWMERNGITTPEDCYGLGYEGAEVAAYWNGNKFLLIRLDDVGKL